MKTRLLLLGALAFVAVGADPILAGTVIAYSDTTWRAIGPVGNLQRRPIDSVGLEWEAAHPGWNTDSGYDDSDAAGWRSALFIPNPAFDNPIEPAQTIWFDGTGSDGSTPSYFRKKVGILGQPTRAILEFGVDDDAKVYLNGTQIINDTNQHGDVWHLGAGTALDVTSYLRPGDNLFAVKAKDSFGFREFIVAKLEVEYVPEPGTLVLLGTGAVGLLGYIRLLRRRR